MRVVIDTNVWISAVLNPAGSPAAVRSALQEHQFIHITSEPLLIELVMVLSRPRFAQKYGVTTVDIIELITLLREVSEIVSIDGSVHLCRDPNDDMVIETALNGRANALVSRDDDLKGVDDIATILGDSGVAVLTVRQFLARLDDTTVG